MARTVRKDGPKLTSNPGFPGNVANLGKGLELSKVLGPTGTTRAVVQADSLGDLTEGRKTGSEVGPRADSLSFLHHLAQILIGWLLRSLSFIASGLGIEPRPSHLLGQNPLLSHAPKPLTGGFYAGAPPRPRPQRFTGGILGSGSASDHAPSTFCFVLRRGLCLAQSSVRLPMASAIAVLG